MLSSLASGTGIAVYFIIANVVRFNRPTECSFILDGILKKVYNHTPTPGAGTEYNYEVYREESLDNAGHILSVETGNKTYEIYIAFDYATYTTEVPDEETPSASDGPEQTNTRPSTGAVVGGVVGGVVLATGAIVGFVLLRRRQQSRATHEKESVPNSPSGHNVGHITPFTGRDTHTPLSIRPDGGLSRKAQHTQQGMDRMREDLSGLQRQQAHTLSASPLSDDGSREISELQEQIRQLQEQLGSFQTHSDALPPEYTG
ncbi:hypothetical protein V5O48_012976 [Marasmius crinis-equi]|uniref:Uncharacterized protein n=1 Tax=Marasmius crinis-equi TaxID=585013 RepID=A0ABR3F1C6_9AGAR